MGDDFPWTEARYRLYASIVAVAIFVASVAISLRMYVRIKITRTFGIDDVTLLFAHALNLVACGVWLYMRRIAMYIDIDSQESYDVLSLPAMLTLIFYIAAGILAKIAIAYWFLAAARTAMQRYIILAPLGLYLFVCSVSTFIVLLRCGTPVSLVRIFNTTECAIGPQVVKISSWVVAILNSVCDWVFATVPLYMVVTAQRMSRNAKMLSSGLIALAVTGSIVSVIRLPFLGHATFGPHFLSSPVSAMAYLLSLTETAVGITVISLATLRPLLVPIRTRWDGHRFQRSNNTSRPGHSHRPILLAHKRSVGHAQDAPTAMADMLSSWDELYTLSQARTAADDGDLKRYDSEPMVGIGILPDVTTSEASDDEDDGDEQQPRRGRSVVQYWPQKLTPARRGSRVDGTVVSISEVLYGVDGDDGGLRVPDFRERRDSNYSAGPK